MQAEIESIWNEFAGKLGQFIRGCVAEPTHPAECVP